MERRIIYGLCMTFCMLYAVYAKCVENIFILFFLYFLSLTLVWTLSFCCCCCGWNGVLNGSLAPFCFLFIVFFFFYFLWPECSFCQLDWNRVVCAWTKNQHVYTIRQTTIHWLISSCVYHFYYIQRVFSCFLFHLFLFRCRTAWVVTELRLQRTFELLSNSANESQRKNNLMKAFNYQT